MDPAFHVLPGDGLPERRTLILTSTEESDGLAIGERVNALVILCGPLTREAQQLNEQIGTEETCRSDPTVIEGIEQGTEVEPGSSGRRRDSPFSA